ncbi:hypothetical protein F4604DRAFT_1688212 [Suillus subluteus]|nr:hypothetical protein F4604DRAFT_1688212 [Suillus subluteus]
MTSETKSVAAVYCSNFDNSRFVCIRIKQFSNGHFQLLDRNDYFQPEVILDEYTIWMNRKYKKPAKFLVLYDRRKDNDGTKKYPYMVLRVGKNDLLQDVTTDHKAILQVIGGSFPASPEQRAEHTKNLKEGRAAPADTLFTSL